MMNSGMHAATISLPPGLTIKPITVVVHDTHDARLGICQKIYTTEFPGERILHTENA